MKDLQELYKQIVERLHEIRHKENKTANEKDEYEQLQLKLRKVNDVMIYIQRMKEGK